MARDRLAEQRAPIARLGDKRHAAERRRVHMPPSSKQLLAYLNCQGKRPARHLERRKHEVPERVVARKAKPHLERLRERVFRSGRHGGNALADITGSRNTCLVAQNARRTPVVGHRNNRRRFDVHREQRANRHGRTGSAAYDDGLHLMIGLIVGAYDGQRGEHARR